MCATQIIHIARKYVTSSPVYARYTSFPPCDLQGSNGGRADVVEAQRLHVP